MQFEAHFPVKNSGFGELIVLMNYSFVIFQRVDTDAVASHAFKF